MNCVDGLKYSCYAVKDNIMFRTFKKLVYSLFFRKYLAENESTIAYFDDMVSYQLPPAHKY